MHILYIYNGICAYIIYNGICAYILYIYVSHHVPKVQHTHENKQFLRPQSGSFGTGMTIAKQIEGRSF